jgi:hypothetical protein
VSRGLVDPRSSALARAVQSVRAMSRLLAIAALPLAACMSNLAGADPDAGSDVGQDVGRYQPPTDQAPDVPSTADLPVKPIIIRDPPLGLRIYAAQITCAGASAYLNVATATPADELELRMAPEVKTGEYGRVYEQRTSYLFDPLLRAPDAIGYPYLAIVPLGDESCADFVDQLQEVRGRFGDKYESHAVQVAPAQTQP